MAYSRKPWCEGALYRRRIFLLLGGSIGRPYDDMLCGFIMNELAFVQESFNARKNTYTLYCYSLL